MYLITGHSDVVGSLLRPPELLEARENVASGLNSQVEFKAIEDRAVDGAIALLEDAGLKVVTDVKQRRLSEGDYDLIARPIFQAIKPQRSMLEYDDECPGSLLPLQDVPEDKMVVLGAGDHC